MKRRNKITRKPAWDCQAFNDAVFEMAPKFDAEILKSFKPTDDDWIPAKITDLAWWKTRESVRRIAENYSFVNSTPTEEELKEGWSIQTMPWDYFVKTIPHPYLQEAWSFVRDADVHAIGKPI